MISHANSYGNRKLGLFDDVEAHIEQNSVATRYSFLTQVNPYLEAVQQKQGLYSFKVIMDGSNNTPDVIDRNQLLGAIYLQPTKTAEFIVLDFNVLPTGATFPA